MHLKQGSVLQGGKYRIVKVLGAGGFGITYLAVQPALNNRKVAIKEFFMKEYCNRDADTSHVSVPSTGSQELVSKFRSKFLKEAGTIAAIDHPHVVRIHDVFEENGTAYYVMEYLGDESLSKRIPSSGMAHEEAVDYIRQIGAALSYIHSQNILHLDIKPSNVLFRHGSEAVLIDFGISKHYDEDGGGQTSTSAGCVSDGYSPTEQYEADGVSSFTASTDIYSLGATFYHLLFGHRPVKASVVLNEGLDFPDSLPQAYRDFIEKAMQPRRKDRPQNIAEFLGLLDVAHQQALTEAEVDETEEDAGDTKIYEGKEEVEGGLNDKDAGEETGDETWVHKSGPPHQPYKSAAKPVKKSYRWWWGTAILIPIAMAALVVKLASDASEIPNPPMVGTQAVDVIINEWEGYHVGHRYVDLGLSVKWATCNIGASTPDAYGDYFAWGETMTKTKYLQENYANKDKLFKDIAGTIRDAAHVKWGGNWRMPTKKEFQELNENCTRTWVTQNGQKGYIVTSKINGQSIFLPAAGYRYSSEFKEKDEYGYYWSSTPFKSNFAYVLFFGDDGRYVTTDKSYYGFSVRPVLED